MCWFVFRLHCLSVRLKSLEKNGWSEIDTNFLVCFGNLEWIYFEFFFLSYHFFLFSRCFPLAAFLGKCVSNENPFYAPLFSFLLPLVILVDIQFRIIYSRGFWQWVCLSFVSITWEFVQSLFTRSFSYRYSIWVLRRKKWSIYEGKTNLHLPLER